MVSRSFLPTLAISMFCCFEATGDAIYDFVQSHCIECHQADEPSGDLNLEDFTTEHASAEKPWDTTAWEKMVRRMRARQMPPAGNEKPTEDEYDDITQRMETILDESANKFPHPGRTDSVRRLNRTEYRNAVRDLLGLKIDVDNLLPADQLSHGFDNVTVSDLSPALLARYITAAERISRLAIGGEMRQPGGITVRLPADRTQEKHVEGLPLGTRGGTLLEHTFPLAGEYEIQLRLMRDRDENIEGLRGSHDIDVLIDRKPIHRFTVAPTKTEKGWSKDDTLVDANLKKRIRVSAGAHKVGVTFPQTFDSLSEIRRKPFEASFNRHRHPRHTPAIYEISIVGPFNPEGPGDTTSRRKVFGDVFGAQFGTASSEVQTDEAARKILGRLMRFAYRRNIEERDFEVPMRFFRERLNVEGFEPAIESALAVILVNPHFLFRGEHAPAGAESGSAYQISDFELASRLSFFLWSSLPDDELLALAEKGSLHQAGILSKQVQRMLADSRASSLVTNFATQWLYLRNLESFKPDMRLFPGFDDNLRTAMRRETELLFQRVLDENRSVLDLIKSDSTFLNERLAKHYGIKQVYGSHFRSVKLDSDSRRGGLLRHGSILAVTSYATRTSPTVRGSWILENVLGTPVPPPPPNIPALKDKTTKAGLGIRERLAEHRENPACASCHDLIDPVGFALENFDAVGRWRRFDQELAVDSLGAMPDGTKISGIGGLEAGIINRPEMFVGTLAEKLLTFALGRGIEPQDGPAIRKVVKQSADENYRMSSIIQGIVSSTPFQMRTAE